MKTGLFAWRYVAVTALCGMAAFSAVSGTVETTPAARMELRARAEIRNRDPGIFGDYWWANRFLNHREQIARLNGRTVDVVLVGDSIMHYWEWRHLAKWSALTNGRTVLNLGYAGDRTQHVLWRIEHGELDGYKAKNVVLMIGTNNNSSDDTDPANVAKAIELIIARIREKQPGAHVILHPIFPRGVSADSKRHAAARARNDRTNVLLKEFAAAHPEVTWVDFNDKLVDSTGWVPRTIMADEIHPTDVGYDLWLEALLPHLRDDRVPLADPFILYEKGTYYAYGTHSRVGITVATSTDLVHWKMDQGRSKDGLALHMDDSFGKKFFWAPEVYRVGGRYVMYYSAETHVCAATADSPLGPFRQAEKKPILERRGIDNSLFIDDDGRAWMVYVHFDKGNVVWLAEMEKDGLHAKPGTARMVLRAEKGWEMMNPRCSVTEGPFIVKIDGTYVLTYSANDYRDRDYAVGVATARSLDGPWTRYAGNPILRRRFGLVGVGHHSLFKDADGKWRIVFHAHNDGGKDAIHPRRMYIAGIDFKTVDGVPVPVVDDNLIRCVVTP